MIYVCEYDHLADDRLLRERLTTLLFCSPGTSRKLPAADPAGLHEDEGGKIKKSNMAAGPAPVQPEEIRFDDLRWKKQRERILARLLLDFALRSEYGLSLEEIDMKTGERGKPYSAAHPEIRFNISHCETACACVIGEGELGIDIERKFSYRENLARKVCHPEEWKMLQTLDEAQRSHQLHLLWSLKESFVKWQGQGLSYGMERVCFAEVLPLGITQRQEEPMHFTVTYSGKIEPCTEAAKRCAEKVDEAGAYGISRAEALEIARQLHFLVKDASAYTLAVCAEQVPDASAIIYKKERELL